MKHQLEVLVQDDYPNPYKSIEEGAELDHREDTIWVFKGWKRDFESQDVFHQLIREQYEWINEPIVPGRSIPVDEFFRLAQVHLGDLKEPVALKQTEFIKAVVVLENDSCSEQDIAAEFTDYYFFISWSYAG